MHGHWLRLECRSHRDRVVSLAAASLPPVGLPGLDPEWSRLISAVDEDGVERTWHILDSHAGRDTSSVEVTLLCVHGNPTWSYLWRRLIGQAPEHVRVVAPDHLDMGYSERTGTVRPLARRVADLSALTDALQLSGPVITVAHDWGGPISLGWALAHRADVVGVVLFNTAVHQPAKAAAPSIIRVARSRPVRQAATVLSPAFVKGTTALSGRRMPRDVARALAAPYATRSRRAAVGEFVSDIPLEPDHVSGPTLDAIAEDLRSLTVPALLLWGPGDPVFSDLYLHDLEARLPHAAVHRYEGARHLVMEDAPSSVDDLLVWVRDLMDGRLAHSSHVELELNAEPMWSAMVARARTAPDQTALVEPKNDSWRRITWSDLESTVTHLAAGLAARGVRSGDRVSVLIPVGADLVAVVYACWRIGASVVVTDAGLGARGILRALRSAHPRYIIGVPKAMALLRTPMTGIDGERIAVAELVSIAAAGRHSPLPPEPQLDDEALVAFTSGSTGPAKGVVYEHRHLQATRDLLMRHYAFDESDALVAAFAPWAVIGPALGMASVIPRMDVTSPRTLTARAVAEATAQVNGSVMWASPAALSNILRTAAGLSDEDLQALQTLRLILGAGAPVDTSILHGLRRLIPEADVRTPYGMTEVLPVCDVTVEQIDAAGSGPGVLVGRALEGVDLCVSAVGPDGMAAGEATTESGVLGEILVRASHGKARYDRLWFTERASARNEGWHRTGDVGTLDTEGRLWVGGRLSHVITTDSGPVAPVEIEQACQRIPHVVQAAAVGVGPAGGQQIVVVCVVESGTVGVADLALHDAVRRETGADIAAVLLRKTLPVDIRHNSKLDRSAIAEWASSALAGRSSAEPV